MISLYLLVVVGAAAVGGLWPALASAVAFFLLANWLFTEPTGTLAVTDAESVLALVTFLVVGVTVSGYVALAARREADGIRLRAGAAALSTLAGAGSTAEVIERLRRTFDLEAVTLWHRDGTAWHRDGTAWHPEATAGDTPARREGPATLTVDPLHELALEGRSPATEDRHVLDAFVTELAVAIHVEELELSASRTARSTADDSRRTAVLAGVSRHAGAPLAQIRACAGRAQEAEDAGERRDLLHTIDGEAERLHRLLGGFALLCELREGTTAARPGRVDLVALVARVVRDGAPVTDAPRVALDDALPAALADPACWSARWPSWWRSPRSARRPGCRPGCSAEPVAAGWSCGWSTGVRRSPRSRTPPTRRGATARASPRRGSCWRSRASW